MTTTTTDPNSTRTPPPVEGPTFMFWAETRCQCCGQSTPLPETFTARWKVKTPRKQQ
jgi:hypothetical protein